MSEDFDINIFKNKKFSDLLEDIYNKSSKRDDQINILIDDLRVFIKTPSDAPMIISLIKDYLDIGVKNDDQLVKMAAIIQRALSKSGTGGGDDLAFELTDEELNNLKEKQEELTKSIDNLDDKSGEHIIKSNTE